MQLEKRLKDDEKMAKIKTPRLKWQSCGVDATAFAVCSGSQALCARLPATVSHEEKERAPSPVNGCVCYNNPAMLERFRIIQGTRSHHETTLCLSTNINLE